MANQNNTTAVDWLLTELNLRLCKIKSEPDGLVRETMINLLLIDTEQAIEMHKTQTEQAYIEGCLDTYGCDKPDASKSDEYFAEQYYNQTYGKSE
jgi:hypothetical protein